MALQAGDARRGGRGKLARNDRTLSASRRLSGEEARRPPAPRPDGRAARWWCNSALEGSMILLVTPDRVRGDGTGKSSPILQTTSPQGPAFEIGREWCGGRESAYG